MSRTLFSLAGFQVITIGRFWVIAEADPLSELAIDTKSLAQIHKTTLCRSLGCLTAKRCACDTIVIRLPKGS
jgi:hypothetical protein